MDDTFQLESEEIEYSKSKTLDDYNIIEKISQGSQGTVYKATTKDKGNLVALKVINIDKSGDNLEQTEKEVSALEKIKCHAFMACYFNHYYDYDKFLIEMEFIEGKDLEKWAMNYHQKKNYNALYYNLVLVLKDMANVLDYIFDKDILHRDIKPSNIMVTKENVPKLIDFGIACDIETCPSMIHSFTKCCTGKVGTPIYMSPETVIEGISYAASDIWSLGASIFQVATLTYCFPVTNPNDMILVFNIITNNNPSILNTNNRTLNSIVNGCLMRDPLLRPHPEDIINFSL